MTCKLLGGGGIYKQKHNSECLLTHIDGLYLFTKLIIADVVYQKNLFEERFSDVRLHSTAKCNQKACVGCA